MPHTTQQPPQWAIDAQRAINMANGHQDGWTDTLERDAAIISRHAPSKPAYDIQRAVIANQFARIAELKAAML